MCMYTVIFYYYFDALIFLKRELLSISFCTEVHLNIGTGKQLTKIKPMLGTTITGVTDFTTIIFLKI